jgi:uncharacterized protein (TIGR00730 family)
MKYQLRSLIVYCGAAKGNNPVYENAAKELAREMVRRNIQLVYGGGSIGLMGVLADEVLRCGGKVIGVIPAFLNIAEVGHTGLTELHEVNSMHERKALMEKLADAAIALPGGFGTLDETFEMLTWAQLQIHTKPIGLLNVNGYYDLLNQQMDRMVEEEFLNLQNRKLLFSSDSITTLLNTIEQGAIPKLA